MTRRYDEPIEVTSALARSERAEPEAFIWRGRLFVVRAVLDRWQERRAWWRETGRATSGPDRPGLDRGAPGDDTLHDDTLHDGRGRDGVRRGVGEQPADRERQVWRVEASPGRAAGSGVFDLGSDGATADGPSQWLLLRAHD